MSEDDDGETPNAKRKAAPVAGDVEPPLSDDMGLQEHQAAVGGLPACGRVVTMSVNWEPLGCGVWVMNLSTSCFLLVDHGRADFWWGRVHPFIQYPQILTSTTEADAKREVIEMARNILRENLAALDGPVRPNAGGTGR